MALSDRLTKLAQRAKEAEDHARAASTTAKETLRSEVDQASAAAQQAATELQQRVAAEDTASDWFAGVRSDWATHVTTARAKVQAKKAKADAKSAQRDAEFATVYAEDAIDFAIGAVEEAEYAVLDAILAQMDADELATATR